MYLEMGFDTSLLHENRLLLFDFLFSLHQRRDPFELLQSNLLDVYSVGTLFYVNYVTPKHKEAHTSAILRVLNPDHVEASS